MQVIFWFSMSHIIPPIAISIFIGAIQQVCHLGRRVDEKSSKTLHRREGVQSKMWCPSHKFFYVLFFVTQSLFLLDFSKSPDNISASNKKSIPVKKQEKAYQCTWNSYLIFGQKYYNSATFSMWVVYTHTCV